jgi:hypothetical protein
MYAVANILIYKKKKKNPLKSSTNETKLDWVWDGLLVHPL